MKGVKNMKKQYVKPELYFENFELSANIATQCADTSIKKPMQFGEKESVFVEVIGCLDPITPDDPNSGYCYHNPTEEQSLFAS